MEVYGLTETSPLSHANPWRGKAKAGSVGLPVPDTDCKIVDVADGTKEMGLGESGEILLKGPAAHPGLLQKTGGDGQGHPGRLVLYRRHRLHGR